MSKYTHWKITVYDSYYHIYHERLNRTSITFDKLLLDLYNRGTISYGVYVKRIYRSIIDCFLEFTAPVSEDVIRLLHTAFRDAVCMDVPLVMVDNYINILSMDAQLNAEGPVSVGCRTIMHVLPVIAARSSPYAQVASPPIPIPRKDKPREFILLMGPDSLGKAAWLKNHLASDNSVYWKYPSTYQWSGYTGQSTLVLDDFNGTTLMFSELLKLVRESLYTFVGSTLMDICPMKTIIVSAMPMKDWYPKRTKKWFDLRACITKIYMFNNSDNSSSANNTGRVPPEEYDDWYKFTAGVEKRCRALKQRKEQLKEEIVELDKQEESLPSWMR